MPILTLTEIENEVAAALTRCRTSETNARIVARALVKAEAEGLKGHGLSRVASYAAQTSNGKVDGHATPVASTPRPGVLAIDAAHGFAFPALDLAVSRLPEIARTQGIATAAIRRSHHCGAAGHPVERLAQAGLVALLFANSPAAMAPWGGAKPLYGTNPLAFACPLPDAEPLVIDLSVSKVARGNILAAKLRGERIPEGWALDENGQPTTDPDTGMRGTMVPMGDAKGTVLALMIELLAAGMIGANYATEAPSYLHAEGPPPGTGQLLIAFAPDAFAADALARFGAMAKMLLAQDGTRLPGARRHTLLEKAETEGLSVTDATLEDIRRL
jgi:(2R)-3-sulfolactate dehydrogenase (NADP+)